MKRYGLPATVPSTTTAALVGIVQVGFDDQGISDTPIRIAARQRFAM
jgi:hypothetical protein